MNALQLKIRALNAAKQADYSTSLSLARQGSVMHLFSLLHLRLHDTICAYSAVRDHCCVLFYNAWLVATVPAAIQVNGTDSQLQELVTLLQEILNLKSMAQAAEDDKQESDSSTSGGSAESNGNFFSFFIRSGNNKINIQHMYLHY